MWIVAFLMIYARFLTTECSVINTATDQADFLQRLENLEESHRFLQDTTQKLESNIRFQLEKKSQLQHEIRLQTSISNKLRIQLDQESKRIAVLEKQRALDAKRIVDLESLVNTNEICDCNGQNVAVNASQKETSNSVVVHDKERTRDIPKPTGRRQTSSGGPEFTVYLSQDVTLGAGQAIPFDQILTNTGNGYNVHTSAFTCLQAGTYMFIFFIGANTPGEKQAFLEVNSVNYVDAVVQPHGHGYDVQGGNALIKQLNVGDVVMVKASANTILEGSELLRTTSFSGVFLHA